MPRDRRVLAVLIAGVVAAGFWISLLVPGPRTLQVTFLDVGDGACTVVKTPSGRIMVVDCGTSGRRSSGSIGRRLAAPYLQSMGVNRIDVAVLSHPHADHISGYPSLLQVEPADMVLDTRTGYRSPAYKDFRKAVKRTHTRYRIAKRGQTLDLGDGVLVQVLSPDPSVKYSDLNNDSIVLRITYGHAAFLLAADAGEEAEHEMLASDTNVRAQVLEVGHHGSHMGTTPEWVAAVRPEAAVISCARRSRYGFPSHETVDRLAASGARVYATSECGAVIATTDGNAIHLRTCGNPR